MIGQPQRGVPRVSTLRPGITRYQLLIPLAALFVVHPLAVHGCSCGHDFDFHLVSWMEAARQFTHGNLHPHWATSPAFNAGEPRFVFYPPLSWMLGAVLGLLLTHLPGVTPAAAWSAAPIVFTWIALTLSGLAMHRLARAFAGGNAALLAAVLYLANPYMLFTAYERTAYGELLAAAWIPPLLLAILRDRITIPGIAIPIALLWLTNPPAAVMGSYTLALLAVIRIVSELSTARPAAAAQVAVRTFAGSALGLALAAFYIVPAAYQRRFVQIWQATADFAGIRNNFLFEHTGTSSDAVMHDQVLHAASLLAVILLAATVLALVMVLLRRKTSNTPFPVIPLAILAAGIAFLLTPPSSPIWYHVPDASFLQFPWRLLAILAPVLALSIAASVDRLRLSFAATGIVAFALLVALTLPDYHVFRQQCYPEDTPPSQFAQFQSQAGTDPTDEYTPTDADNDALAQNDPPYWLAPWPSAPAPTPSQPGPAPMRFNITAPQPEYLILNLRSYPAWRVVLNGVLDPTRSRRDDGLIAFPIPAGASTVDLRYAHTRDQTIGDLVSLLALLVLLVMWLAHRCLGATTKVTL